METVQKAMLLAADRFKAVDGRTFNAAGFAHAMVCLTGVKQFLDGKMVAAILDGRQDVMKLSGGSHYRVKPIGIVDTGLFP
jgi:hypothetical protein